MKKVPQLTRIQYRILRRLGDDILAGGDGVTRLCYDHAAARGLVIKGYLAFTSFQVGDDTDPCTSGRYLHLTAKGQQALGALGAVDMLRALRAKEVA